MARTSTVKRGQKKEVETDAAVTYNEFKEFEGKKYTGMKIGRGHKWYYDKGEWKETKITPDLWQISYAVAKRRAGRAPEGSGVPVGTEYHWYIAAHQNVRKLNANDYTTALTGLKFKIAHKRADSEKWSATDRTQRKRLIKFLHEVIDQLEQQAAEAEPVAVGEPAAAKPATKAAARKRRVMTPKSMTKPARRRRKAAA